VSTASVLLAALLLLPQALTVDDDPRAVARQALRAVEGDSVAVVRTRWELRLRTTPGDRAAALGLATIHLLSYRYADAEREFTRLTAADSARPDRYAVYARLGLAQTAFSRRMMPVAIAQFERAAAEARLVGDTAAEAQALLNAAYMRARSQDATAGLAALDSVASLIPAGDVELRAWYHARRAALLAQLGRPETRKDADQCMALARQAGQVRTVATCLHTLAIDAERRGAVDSAIAMLGEVADMYRRARDRVVLASALQWRGHLLSVTGQYGAARADLRESIENGELSGNGNAVAWAALGLATISRLLQDRELAAQYVARAAAMFEAQRDVWGAAGARELQADLAVDRGDLDQARALTLERLRWAQQAAQPQMEFDARAALAAVAERQRDWATATEELDSARLIARRGRMDGKIADLAYQSGRMAMRRGKLGAAERDLASYLRTLGPDRHAFRYLARARLAEVYARRGDLASAERELVRASDEFDEWRAGLSDRELRVAAFQTNDEEDSDIGVPRVLATLATGGRAEAAFALAERRRARDLADRLIQGHALRVAAGDTQSISDQLRFPTGEITAASASAALPDSATAILEYVAGDAGAPTTLFVITRAGVRAAVLPPADSLAPLVERFVALLERGNDPRVLSRTLGAAVLDPALTALGAFGATGEAASRLVVVPDGPLHRLPFDALRLAGGQYAIERFTISVTPSASVARELWRRGAERPQVAGPLRLLAFGDPTFAAESRSQSEATQPTRGMLGGLGRPGPEAYRSAFDSAGGLPRLSASGEEARLVARYAPQATVRLRSWATESYLKHASLTDYRVIHFATHALVDDRSIGRTALALAPGGGETGFVAPGDLAALRLDADLVVLSACRTAGGVVVDGEGVQGLTAPLLEAGARSVVATAWRIADRSTVDFVRDFYSSLAAGLPVGDALRAAKLAALRRGAPPGEWAAFGVVGDPLVTVPLRAPAPERPWWLAAPAVAALAVPVYWVRRRGRAPRRG
jgi:CHAT domain-containing protein/tetratricopeptide (TPR) repeat protein